MTKTLLKNTAITLGAPLTVYLLLLALTVLTGHSGFGVGADLKTIMYNMVFSGFIALALSYHLTSGRIDFSIGSVLLLSAIAGGNLAKAIGVGPFGLVAIVLAVGLVCGTVSGLVYITLRLPAMISSLGVTMIFESIGYMINRSNGVRMIGRFDVLIWAAFPVNILFLLSAVAVLTYLLNFTKFGYDSRSLESGQKNAVEVGVNENRNALLSYVLSGGLMALAAVVYLSQYGYVAPQTGLSSTSFLMGAFLPLFIGGALAKYSDRNLGVVIGAFIQASLSSGMVKMGVTSSLKTVLDGCIALLFFVYLTNSHKILLARLRRRKLQAALAAQGSQESAVGR